MQLKKQMQMPREWWFDHWIKTTLMLTQTLSQKSTSRRNLCEF